MVIIHLFSVVTFSSIELHYDAEKIERAKNLIIKDNLTLTEVLLSVKLQQLAHLSTQFKNITGITTISVPENYYQKKKKRN